MTESEEIEARLLHIQKMAAIGQLASGIAHDFNNLLTVIIGCADMVAQQLHPDSAARADVDQIHEAASSAASLAKTLLSFSRKSAGRLSVLDANAIVTQISKMLGRVIGENIQVVVRRSADDVHVEAERSQIEQVIVNLAVNARDAMPHGGILTIELGAVTADTSFARTHGVRAGATLVKIVVSDTGVGMSADVQARAFDRFFTTKEPNKGTGLGLATVHEIVRRAGGVISVQSVPGRGTSFTVCLPRVTAPVDGRRETVSPPVCATAAAATILFVEDDDGIRALGERVLRWRGHTVLIARDAEEAIAIAEHAATIDLLFTDVVLPGIDGRTLAEHLRRQRPKLKVVFTSGYGEYSAVLRDLELDDSEYLHKPYASESLAAKVAQALNRRDTP